MLEKILNKKVSVGVAFGEMGTGNYTKGTSTKYYDGIVVAYDDDFIVFDNDSMIGIKYIQTIQVL